MFVADTPKASESYNANPFALVVDAIAPIGLEKEPTGPAVPITQS